MRDVMARRATPAAKAGDGDQEAYFRLSLFSAERTRIRGRLDELQAQQNALRRRLEIVEAQMQKLQAGLVSRSAESSADAVRSPWNEIELEY